MSKSNGIVLQNNSVELVTLNDDCLAAICKYLTLSEQLDMFAVCRRFAPVLRHVWRSKYHSIGEEILQKLPDNDFCTLMDNICETAAHYRWQDAWNTPVRFEIIKKFVFPKVHELRTLRGFINLVDVAKMFPNLTTLVVDQSITTLDLLKFKHLQELSFVGATIECEDLEKLLTELPIKLLKIYTSGKAQDASLDCTLSSRLLGKLRLEEDLPYLESMYLGSDVLPSFPTTTIKHMKNLKELIITDFVNTAIIKAMCETVSEHIPSTAIDIFRIRDGTQFIAQVPKANLRKLAFYQIPDWTVFKSILEFLNTQKTIQIVEFESCIIKDSNELKQFLENSPNLEGINLYRCSFQNGRLRLSARIDPSS